MKKECTADQRKEATSEIESVTAENLKLRNQLALEARKRKELMTDNIYLCKKLDMRKRECMTVGNCSTYVGKVRCIIESPQRSKAMACETTINEINASLLALPNESFVVLGEGQFGCVQLMSYRGIEVAVKILKGDSSKGQLIHEATVIREIGDHPGIPYVYGICCEGSNKMLVMQCCTQSGKVITLHDAMSQESNFGYLWTTITVKLTQALLFIHKRGYVHNNLKENNELLCLRGQTWQPVIIDYGKSVKTSNAKAKKCTHSCSSLSELKKKYPHIAPELLCGQMPPSLASDVYSLGVIFRKYSAKLEDPYLRLTTETILVKLQAL